MSTALITGIAGQDGYYLAREMQQAGYDVVGVYHGQDEHRLARLMQELPFVHFERGDVTDPESMNACIRTAQPDAVFNLAARSFVGISWQMPRAYMDTNCGGLINVLEAVRRYAPKAHVIQASTSEMFGNVTDERWPKLNENSPMEPVSPYGVSKLAAHRLCGVYRESYGMRVTSAISFNHESPRRPPLFVTRKVTMAAARIAAGLQDKLVMGNLGASRDWGYAADFMRAYRLMAEAEKADDYVVGTGERRRIVDLLHAAFAAAGVPDWRKYVETSDEFARPNDLIHLEADASKLRARFGWAPSVTFEEMVQDMVMADMVKETVAV